MGSQALPAVERSPAHLPKLPQPSRPRQRKRRSRPRRTCAQHLPDDRTVDTAPSQVPVPRRRSRGRLLALCLCRCSSCFLIGSLLTSPHSLILRRFLHRGECSGSILQTRPLMLRCSSAYRGMQGPGGSRTVSEMVIRGPVPPLAPLCAGSECSRLPPNS
ncbi:uncharacterized protein LOC118620512 isoform X2 [Molossus molossus]|uniref:uncharacterized protein LOC118620512 isoform X2 n=1 Tax=Molossus molossus TaxID=27622 RepID=UPI001746F7C4|nr:uncharacterized protein LOC118620512 isoform X2 [Molossus molossus]XP_036103542.1 uncharacterized protein LOC118620512 isoform X2 [Molossus molossus]